MSESKSVVRRENSSKYFSIYLMNSVTLSMTQTAVSVFRKSPVHIYHDVSFLRASILKVLSFYYCLHKILQALQLFAKQNYDLLNDNQNLIQLRVVLVYLQ